MRDNERIAGRVSAGGDRVTGFTLLELLVAMLIAGIGLMGIVALQLKTLQFNYDALIRSQVSIAIQDVTDRIRHSRDMAKLFATGGKFVVGRIRAGTCDETAFPVSGDEDATKQYRNCWLKSAERDLPSGSTMEIEHDGSDQFTIRVGWYDRDERFHSMEYSFIHDME